MSKEYKVGDKIQQIRVPNTDSYGFIGRTGTIVSPKNLYGYYMIEWTDGMITRLNKGPKNNQFFEFSRKKYRKRSKKYGFSFGSPDEELTPKQKRDFDKAIKSVRKSISENHTYTGRFKKSLKKLFKKSDDY